MAIEHDVIPDGERHEPKGLSSAANGKVYISRGSDTGEWVYLPMGWGNYADNATAQTFNTTPAKLSVNGAGSTSDSNYLPREIRGSAELWDATSDKITPIRAGDSFNVRVNLPVTAKTGTPTAISIQIDIGGGAAPTIVVTEIDYPVTKTPPYTVTVSIPIFCLATFVANGGQVFIATDTGTLDITAPSIFIDMNTSGTI